VDAEYSRHARGIPYVVECLICGMATTGVLDGGWVTPPDNWFAGDRYFTCGTCARMVRQTGISVEYCMASDSNLRLLVSWEVLRDGKGMPLPRLDVIL
jgi:hypothetical protein